MVTPIIPAFTKHTVRSSDDNVLDVAECFMDTIQGEGATIGTPSIFLRLRYCTLNCTWCDTSDVWKQGGKYTIKQLIELFKQYGAIDRLRQGHHLIITGGSPLRQQTTLAKFLTELTTHAKQPIITEIENECVLLPTKKIIELVTIWNNSPKLANSNMPQKIRYKPHVLKTINALKNSTFKFVITNPNDWKEIEDNYLRPGLIDKHKIYLMPEATTQQQLHNRYDMIVRIATEHNVKITDRLHITIWNQTVGV